MNPNPNPNPNSGPLSGVDLNKLARKPGAITWAALAAVVQLGGLVLPGAMRLQALETKIDVIEQSGSPALQRHVAESNSRYTEIIRQLTRIEAAVEHRTGRKFTAARGEARGEE